MDSTAKVALGIAGAVVAIGAAVGVGAYAAGLAAPAPQAGDPVSGGGAPGGSRLGQGRGSIDSTRLAASLASKLGVDQARVEQALTDVLAANRPSSGPSAPPSGIPSSLPSGQPGQAGGFRGARLETLAKGLAATLNLDEAKVLAALEEVMADRMPGQPSASPTSR